MVLSFLDLEGTDPSSASHDAAEGMAKARASLEKRGVKSFLFFSTSPEEFDQRAQFGGVAEAIEAASDLYLSSPDGRDKLVAGLRSEFVADKDPCGGCPAGTKCTCTHEGCKCVKESKVVEAEYTDKWAEKDGPRCDHRGCMEEPDEVYDNYGLYAGRWCEKHESESPGYHRDYAGADTESLDEDYPNPHRGYEGKRAAKGEWTVCPTCEGEGSHVNPSIDAHGIGAEEFNEDPDFREDYFSGAYDVPCAECGGRNVVPKCATPGCDEPADTKDQGYGDRRDRVSTEHYDKCYEHLDPDDKEDVGGRAEMFAEQEAERRMGA